MTSNNQQLTDQEKIRAAKNAYQREWARKNPEKVKEYQDKHYLKRYEQQEQAAAKREA